MKKLLIFLMLAMLSACLLASCGAPKIPADESVIEAYHRASEAYSWFDVLTLPCDYSDTVEVDGMPYARVNRFPLMVDFRNHLEDLFAIPIVDRLLAGDAAYPQYIERDGKLYALDAARGTDIGKGAETYSVRQTSKTSLILTVTVEILDYSIPNTLDAEGKVIGSETYEFPFEYVNGKWVFTDFRSVR